MIRSLPPEALGARLTSEERAALHSLLRDIRADRHRAVSIAGALNAGLANALDHAYYPSNDQTEMAKPGVKSEGAHCFMAASVLRKKRLQPWEACLLDAQRRRRPVQSAPKDQFVRNDYK